MRDFMLTRTTLGSSHGDPVSVRWLGTAGFEITFAGSCLLIDPYVSRVSLVDIARGGLVVDAQRVAATFPKADAIVAGHAHFDHIMDVPTIAKLTGARVFGSTSAERLCRAEGVPASQIKNVESSRPITQAVGPFELTFVPSAHSPLALGRIPFPGEIVDCAELPMPVHAYKCGAVFGVDVRVGGRRIYHVGSAEILESGRAPIDVDLALVCVAGWPSTHQFPERVCRALNPKAVVLSHWDNFFRPMEAPAQALPAMRGPELVERLTRTLRGNIPVGALPIGGHVTV